MISKTVVINKPKGKTSFQVVREFKKTLPIGENGKKPKVGHAGTLDPFATGVLVLLVGKATKRFSEFQEMEKEYLLTVGLGMATDSGDITGKVTKTSPVSKVKKPELKKILKELEGTYMQTVPVFSAAKHKGKPLYKYAREGKKVLSKKKPITIHSISLEKGLSLGRDNPWLGIIPPSQGEVAQFSIRVVCSSGTYMRQLAVDIGEKLEVPAVALALHRTRVGSYTVKQARKV